MARIRAIRKRIIFNPGIKGAVQHFMEQFDDTLLIPPTRNPLRRLYNWVLHWAKTPYGVPVLFILAFTQASFFPIPPDVLLVALCMGLPKRWAWFALICTVGSVSGSLFGYGIGYFLSDSVGEVLMRFVGKLFVQGGPEMLDDFMHLHTTIATLSISSPQFAPIAESLQRVVAALSSDSSYALTTADKALWLRSTALNWFNCPQPRFNDVVLGPWAVGIAGFSPVPYKVFTVAAGMFKMPLVPFLVASVLSRGGRFFLVAGIIGLTYRIFGNRLEHFIDRYFGPLCLIFTIVLLGGFYLLKFL